MVRRALERPSHRHNKAGWDYRPTSCRDNFCLRRPEYRRPRLAEELQVQCEQEVRRLIAEHAVRNDFCRAFSHGKVAGPGDDRLAFSKERQVRLCFRPPSCRAIASCIPPANDSEVRANVDGTYSSSIFLFLMTPHSTRSLAMAYSTLSSPGPRQTIATRLHCGART